MSPGAKSDLLVVNRLNQVMRHIQLPQGGCAIGSIQDHVTAPALQCAIDRRSNGRILQKAILTEPFDQRLNPAGVNIFMQDEGVGG